MIRRASDWLARALGVPAHHGRVWLWRPQVGSVRIEAQLSVWPAPVESYAWASIDGHRLVAGAEADRWDARLEVELCR